MFCTCREGWWRRNFLYGFVFVFIFLSWADFLCSIGPDLPRHTSKPLHHRNLKGDAAEILWLALYAQYGTSLWFLTNTCFFFFFILIWVAGLQNTVSHDELQSLSLMIIWGKFFACFPVDSSLTTQKLYKPEQPFSFLLHLLVFRSSLHSGFISFTQAQQRLRD